MTHRSSGYDFTSKDARLRWQRCAPCRLVNRDLGYPVLVVDDDGEPVDPGSSEELEVSLRADQSKRWQEAVEKAVSEGWVELENRESQIEGLGVFTKVKVAKNTVLGYYNGTVHTTETWEELTGGNDENESEGESENEAIRKEIASGEEAGQANNTMEADNITLDENFLFNLNDGAHGVMLDGKHGDFVNELKYLNHSCEPNVKMQEVFLDGAWGVIVYALRDLAEGEELTHDFALHTEDPDEALILCRCQTSSCRQRLFAYFPWDD